MRSHDPKTPTRVIVLGSTGSIGRNTLEVIDHLNQLDSYPHQFDVVGLAAATNHELLIQQARSQQVQRIALAASTPESASLDFNGTAFTGPDAARELICNVEADLVVAAVVGFAGLPAVIAAIQAGRTIALANKETLVAAGDFVMPLARLHKVDILPIDSEHSAIFQCLQSRLSTPEGTNDSVRRIILTASGGPFRTWSRAQIAEATLEEALNHPTWNMGAKVTIDSASLTNKALEMIEAHHLFGFGNDRIDVLVHPQSIVHGLVEFQDGSVLAQMGPPDMRTPIQYALTFPERPRGCTTNMDWSELTRLDFERPDTERFPSLELARHVIETGGTSGAILNAANEVAVHKFLHQEIAFDRIARLARETLEAIPHRPISNLHDVVEADQAAREFARSQVPV